MRILYGAYFVGLPVLFGAALVFPVAILFHRGITYARTEEQRVTPDGSWIFFRRGVLRARGAWLWLGGALCLLALFGGQQYWPMHSEHQSWLITALFASGPLATALTIVATSCLVGFLIAPRFCRLISLGAVMGLTTAVLFWLGQRGLLAFLPGGWLTVRHSYQINNLAVSAQVAAPFYPFIQMAVFGALALVSYAWAKSRGNRWFRF